VRAFVKFSDVVVCCGELWCGALWCALHRDVLCWAGLGWAVRAVLGWAGPCWAVQRFTAACFGLQWCAVSATVWCTVLWCAAVCCAVCCPYFTFV
jgi:hypothetical protein